MSLRSRILIAALAVTACVILLAIAALRGFSVTRAHVDASAARSDELRALYQIGHDAALAQQALRAQPPDTHAVRRALNDAHRVLDEIERTASSNALLTLRSALESAQRTLDDPRSADASLTSILSDVRRRAGDVRTGLIEARFAASAHAQRTERALLALVVVAVLLTIGAAITIHRAVMRPLQQLSLATQRIARADFSERVPEQGPGELRELAAQFNRMASEIDSLHSTMAQRVEAQSQQLVRSEELASVGHLAAGVAHEINNPLGIIAGYAERAVRRAERSDEPIIDDATLDALRIICDEAFRGREITGDLLRMARPAKGAAQPVDLVGVTDRAITLARGLPAAANRTLISDVSPDKAACIVQGDESQLIQVILNLLANALESCAEHEGRVVVGLDVNADEIRLTVRDNGCGMDDTTLRHAFDAFYTDKLSRGLSGTGLGLSISHAIAQQHGGRLHAESDGRDHGSLLTLTLPRWTGAAEHADACA